MQGGGSEGEAEQHTSGPGAAQKAAAPQVQQSERTAGGGGKKKATAANRLAKLKEKRGPRKKHLQPVQAKGKKSKGVGKGGGKGGGKGAKGRGGKRR